MSSSDREEEANFAAMIKERAREKMIESMREKDYEGFESAKDHYEYADRYLDDYFTSEFNKLDNGQGNVTRGYSNFWSFETTGAFCLPLRTFTKSSPRNRTFLTRRKVERDSVDEFKTPQPFLPIWERIMFWCGPS
ncbi:hypothetical protein ACTXT7_017486 [Hymenolepis weldensis]